MAARFTVLCATLASARAAIELTPDNFDKEVFQSGKAAFIKFLAPW
jgi:protein disulfide-isomerase A6